MTAPEHHTQPVSATPVAEPARDRRSPRRTERIILAAGLTVAVALPAAAWLHAERRVADDLEPALSQAIGAPVDIGGIEAGLTGEVWLRDVQIGDLLSVASVEAGVALDSALAGRFRPDQLRVRDPHLTIRVAADGSSNLTRVLSRLRERRATHAPGKRDAGVLAAHRPNLALTGGRVTIDLGERGRARLTGVTVTPASGGIRAVADIFAIDARHGPWHIVGEFDRVAADVDRTGLRRALAVNGGVAITAPDAALALADVTLSHAIGAPDTEIRGRIAGDRPGHVSARIDRATRRLAITGRDVPLAILAPVAPKSLDLTDARATGQVGLALGPTLAITADADVDSLILDDRRLATRSIPWSGRARLQASLSRPGGKRTMDIEQLAIDTGALTVAINGSAHYDGPGSWLPDRGSAVLQIFPVSCSEALGSLPEPMRAHLIGLDMAGTFEAAAELVFDRADVNRTDLDLAVDAAGCRVLRDARAGDPARLLAAFDHRFPDGSTRRIDRRSPGYVTLRQLPRHLTGAFVTAEDGRFFRHRGFDARQIERSLAIDLRDGAFVRGGSTISQQLVKNVFLTHDRDLVRKLQEAIITWRVEATLDKRRILENYLNIIELGPGVFGLDQAARHWFDKPASRLTVRESALLAALTPAPRTISRRIAAAGGIDDATARRIGVILRVMRKGGVISEGAYQRAKARRLTLNPAIARTGDRAGKLAAN